MLLRQTRQYFCLSELDRSQTILSTNAFVQPSEARKRRTDELPKQIQSEKPKECLRRYKTNRSLLLTAEQTQNTTDEATRNEADETKSVRTT